MYIIFYYIILYYTVHRQRRAKTDASSIAWLKLSFPSSEIKLFTNKISANSLACNSDATDGEKCDKQHISCHAGKKNRYYI